MRKARKDRNSRDSIIKNEKRNIARNKHKKWYIIKNSNAYTCIKQNRRQHNRGVIIHIQTRNRLEENSIVLDRRASISTKITQQKQYKRNTAWYEQNQTDELI